MNSNTLPSDVQTGKVLSEVDLLTQLHQAEARAKVLQQDYDAMHERYSYMLKATQDAVWDWDLVKNTGWYSENLCVLFGYKPSELIDGVQFWYTTIHPDDKDRVVNGLHAVIGNGGKNWTETYRFRKADGTFAWVKDRGYAILDETGKPVRMVGSMQDITREVETANALRQREELLRATFDQAAVAISIATPAGKFVSVNKAYPKMFGYTEHELYQKTINDLSHPDEVEADKKFMADLLSGRSQFATREKRYHHKSGRIVWGRVFESLIYDSNDQPKYVVGVVEDVTEQRAAHETLKYSEDRLRLVIDSGRIGTWDFDPRTGVLFWDDRCKAMFGMHPEDIADYNSFLERIHPEDRQAADEANQNAIRSSPTGEYEFEYRTIGLRDHKLRWVRAKGKAFKDNEGNTYRYAGTVIDITEQKERENSLRVQEQRFRLLANSIPQIVWTTREDGIVDYMSDKWFAYTRQTPTYDKFSFRQLMHPDDLDDVTAEWTDCIKAGIEYHGEYRLKNIETNEYRWYSCTTAPLKNHDGKVIMWVGSATDIHDQKIAKLELEEKVVERTRELIELNQRLEKSNLELEQYAYVTSHDLKEPLRKIQTYSNLIATRYRESIPPEVTGFISKVDAAALRMSGLIEDLLKYSRLSNPLQLFDQVDLNTIVKNVAADFEHLLNDRQVTIALEQLPVVKAIPIQMQQLFSNLISNSLKFSKAGKPNRIRISASLIHQTYPGIVAHDYHCIIFQDEGIGFEPRFNDQIFTIFQRLNNRHDYEGHGIGLALCRKIMDTHKGYIQAEGKDGEGATFTILFPAEKCVGSED